MFETDPSPRLFGLPPGVNFPAQVVAGVLERVGEDPLALARIQILVNTRRMARELTVLFSQGPARLLPRIETLEDFLPSDLLPELPPKAPALERRLRLARMVAALLKTDRGAALGAAPLELAESLEAIFGEMEFEGVTADSLARLDVGDFSLHWAQALEFLSIAGAAELGQGPEARLRAVAERCAELWATTPPRHPVLLVGSTGSRGATALLMAAVARLPRGAVILPGLDPDLPSDVLMGLDAAGGGEDHAQFRVTRLLRHLELEPSAIAPWREVDAPDPARNRVISLALRPAPVTDRWLEEGAALEDLAGAMANVTLVEARSRREEALAIAVRLRQAVQDGQKAALITPDRLLARQVNAQLDRWGIRPDDSAGRPLDLSAPGRLLRATATLPTTTVTGEALLSLAKHPLVNNGGDRSDHLLFTRELELWLRRKRVAYPDARTLSDWAKDNRRRQVWAAWLGETLTELPRDAADLGALVDWHLSTLEHLATGPRGDKSTLWDGPAGEEAARAVADLRAASGAGGNFSIGDYAALIETLLAGRAVRDSVASHPGVAILGTLEARAQGAELAILGSLNEGRWPAHPAPDPWLNRMMRQAAGLLLPERQIGLAAHDFQQAAGAPVVWLTRAKRSDDAETVPSRWINRLTNLLGGLEAPGGHAALAAMRSRGQRAIALANRVDRPGKDMLADPRLEPAQRPSPRPPLSARPKALSVTQFETLCRDPYSIYAIKVLGLNSLDPLTILPDALLKGIALHGILHRFVERHPPEPRDTWRDRLIETARTVLEETAPWPTVQLQWLGQVERFADGFLIDEAARQDRGRPQLLEARREVAIPGLGFTLRAQADRLDLAPDGTAWIYDYKSGAPPSGKAQLRLHRQLFLEAVMLRLGAFVEKFHPDSPISAAYIGLGQNAGEVRVDFDSLTPEAALEELIARISAMRQRDWGFTAWRIAPAWGWDYGQLARYGEWVESDEPVPEDVG